MPFTVKSTVVCAVNGPLVPVTVIVADPIAALALADRVRTLDVPAGFGLNVADTPLGRPVAVNVTCPANPPLGNTSIVDVPLVR